MKCAKCGADLIPGNNICPKCGSLNIPFGANSNTNNITSNNQNIEIMDLPEQNNNIPNNDVVDLPSMKDNSSYSDTEGIMEDIDDGPAEVVNASANMSIPTLKVDNNTSDEISNSVSQDISAASNNASIYSPEELKKEETEQAEIKEREKDKVEIAIPESKGPVTNNNTVYDNNGVPVMKDAPKETVGTVKDESKVKNNPKLNILKSKVIPRNVVIILVVISLVLGILLGRLVLSTNTTSSIKINKTTTAKIVHVTDGANNETIAGVYKFKVPTTYTFDKYNDGIIVYGTNDSFKAYIKALQGDYDSIASARESIVKSFTSNGITVNNISEVSLYDNNYLLIEITTSIYNKLIAIRKANDDMVFYIEINDLDNTYNRDPGLKVADDVCDNAEYQDNNNLTKLESINISDFADYVTVIGNSDAQLKNKN